MPEKHALIVVDYQRDFIDGSLAVPGAKDIEGQIAAWCAIAVSHGDLIVLSRDWHPANHKSFSEHPDYLHTFPPHCVADTEGAEYGIDLPRMIRGGGAEPVEIIKGFDPTTEAFSAFGGFTPPPAKMLHTVLQEAGVTTVIVMGLALDFCVKATALDASLLGYNVVVNLAGTRAVNPDGAEIALLELAAADVTILAGIDVMAETPLTPPVTKDDFPPHTAVEVPSLPDCDICNDGTKAQYDARTRMGKWANLCEQCFHENGGTLGLGAGQRLLVRQAA